MFLMVSWDLSFTLTFVSACTFSLGLSKNGNVLFFVSMFRLFAVSKFGNSVFFVQLYISLLFVGTLSWGDVWFKEYFAKVLTNWSEVRSSVFLMV